jgi:hypothetical protein
MPVRPNRNGQRRQSSNRNFRGRLAEASDRLERVGFIPTAMVTDGVKKILTDPSYGRPAHVVQISSAIGSGGSGSAPLYSNVDFFGRQYPFYWSFLVVDDEKFEEFKAKSLTPLFVSEFLRHNPNAVRGLRVAFTKFLHQRGMYWDGEVVRKGGRVPSYEDRVAKLRDLPHGEPSSDLRDETKPRMDSRTEDAILQRKGGGAVKIDLP